MASANRGSPSAKSAIYGVVIPDGEADPGSPAAKSHKVPALHFVPAGMTSFCMDFFWTRFGAHSGHPTAHEIVLATSG